MKQQAAFSIGYGYPEKVRFVTGSGAFSDSGDVGSSKYALEAYAASASHRYSVVHRISMARDRAYFNPCKPTPIVPQVEYCFTSSLFVDATGWSIPGQAILFTDDAGSMSSTKVYSRRLKHTHMIRASRERLWTTDDHPKRIR